jgi:hypothetical protein
MGLMVLKQPRTAVSEAKTGEDQAQTGYNVSREMKPNSRDSRLGLYVSAADQ